MIISGDCLAFLSRNTQVAFPACVLQKIAASTPTQNDTSVATSTSHVPWPHWVTPRAAGAPATSGASPFFVLGLFFLLTPLRLVLSLLMRHVTQ